jgi:transcriptional regulator with XRE-family HTH domain
MGKDMARSHPVDVHVGARIRQRRALLGMTQSNLGTAVGLTYQQIQKYERGADRVFSSRLFEFSKVLDVPVDYFFEQLASASGRDHEVLSKTGTHLQTEADDLMVKHETFELVRAYYKVHETRVRRDLAKLIRDLGTAGQEKSPARRRRKLRRISH